MVASPSRERKAVVEDLGEEMVRLTRAGNALRAQVLASEGSGVEWATYALLFHLVREGAQRASALAETACVDPSTVSRQVAQLVERGLVERRADPDDGRATLLVPTEAGCAAHAAMLERRRRSFALLLADWSDEDVDTLTRLLQRYNDTVAERRPLLTELLAPAGSPPRTPPPPASCEAVQSRSVESQPLETSR